MAYEYFYPGSASSMDPDYGDFTGYKMKFSRLGAPTSIQTANQVQEVSNLLNQGIKTIELQPISPEVFDQIPKQHFKEIARLQEIAGGKEALTTIHAPMVEPSGITKEGWSESDRLAAERQLMMVVEKSHDLNPNGNFPITIHASAIPGTEIMPVTQADKDRYRERFMKQEGRAPTSEEMKAVSEKRIIAINQETKQITGIEPQPRVYPYEVAGAKGEITPVVRTPREELKIMNRSEWLQSLTNVIFYKNRGDETLEAYYPVVKQAMMDLNKQVAEKKITQEEAQMRVNHLPDAQKAAYGKVQEAQEYLENSRMVLDNLFSKAYRFGTEEEKAFLKRAAEEFTKKIRTGDPAIQSQAIQDMSIQMQNIQPKSFVPIEDFARDKSSETFANVALKAYKEYGNNSPIISIENLYPGMAFSSSEQLKGLIEEARNKFVKKAEKEGISKSQAEEAAKRFIGATWDVGHLNIMRKEGFKTEDIVRESEEIAKYVKHVHLTDNFGYSDSHLPPGMGNVPVKEIMEKLEKGGFKGKGIVEAGGFFQHFKTSPMKYVLEAFGSPIYPMIAQPTWNQVAGIQGNYFAFPSAYLPEQHFSMYGGGFSGMPAELGGQMPGKQSRVSGNPME